MCAYQRHVREISVLQLVFHCTKYATHNAFDTDYIVKPIRYIYTQI